MRGVKAEKSIEFGRNFPDLQLRSQKVKNFFHLWLPRQMSLTLSCVALFQRPRCVGGGANMPPLGKSISECLSPILFYTVNYTYIRSSNLKGFCPSFNTLDLAALQSSPSKSIYASNFRKSEKIQRKFSAKFFWRAVKN